MKPSLLRFAALLACGVPFAKAYEIITDYTVSADQIMDVGNTYFNGDLVVDKDKFLAIVSGVDHFFNGDVIVDGGLYIGSQLQTSGITANVAGLLQKVENNGIIVVDAHNTTDTSSYLWDGASFSNNGELYFNAQSSLTGSDYHISPVNDFVNNGLLSFSHENGRKGGSLHLGNLGADIENSGTICSVSYTHLDVYKRQHLQ